MLLAVTVVCALAVVNLRRSNTGRRFLAVRANEAAAAAAASTWPSEADRVRVSSFLAGLGGAMLAYLRGQIGGDSFSVFVSLSLLAFAYLGGIGLVSGAVVAGLIAPGGLVVGVTDELFGGENLDTYANLIGGIGLILTAILNTDGVAGKVARNSIAGELHARRA